MACQRNHMSKPEQLCCGRRSGAAHSASVVDMQALAEEASFWRQPTHAVRMSVERLRCLLGHGIFQT